MSLNDWAFIIAGGIGALVAVVHGVLTHRLLVLPIYRQEAYPESMRRLVAVLLQFSTFCWFAGGLGLMAAPYYLDTSGQMMIAAIVAGFYSFGAVGNFWGTRGKHPGWALLTTAICLIAFGIATQ